MSEPAPGVPRVWPVFAAIAAAFAGAVAVSVAAAVVIAATLMARDTPRGELEKRVVDALMDPPVFIAVGLASQAMFLAAALVPAAMSKQPARSRLGLVPARLPRGGYAVLAVASILPLAIGVGAAMSLAEVLPPDGSVERLYAQMTRGAAGPFLLFIALVPAVVEELLFRGYAQRRLLERWPPAVAILVTSILFGLCHGTAHAILFATILGVWFGVVAWRTGSAIPGMVCHGFVNGAWNVLQIGQRLEVLPAEIPAVAWVILGVLVLAAFALALRLLIRATAVSG
jgi:membrane protease YdiL (CAAX protease family)